MHIRYNSESDADFSPSELSGEDDPLEYDSQTEEPEPRHLYHKFNRNILETFGCGSGSRRLPRPKWWRVMRAKRWTLLRSIPKIMIARERGFNFCMNTT